MFMSADVSRQGRLAMSPIRPDCIPSKESFELTGDAKEAYCGVFGENMYHWWIETMKKGSPGLARVATEVGANTSDPTFVHEAIHDAESLFWVLTWTLLLVDPVGLNKRTCSTNHNQMVNNMLDHGRYKTTLESTRETEFNRDQVKEAYRWKINLGEPFGPICTMLARMQVHFSFPWYRVDANDFNSKFMSLHGFEVLRRQLLAAIFTFMPSTDIRSEAGSSNNSVIKLNRGFCCKWKETGNNAQRTTTISHILSPGSGSQSPRGGPSRPKRQKAGDKNQIKEMSTVEAIMYYSKLRHLWFPK
jgi:hypothetical protein